MEIERREKRRCESRAREEQRRGSDGESTAFSRALAATYPPNQGARRLQNFITPARIFLPERGRAESFFYCLGTLSFSPSFSDFFFFPEICQFSFTVGTLFFSFFFGFLVLFRMDIKVLSTQFSFNCRDSSFFSFFQVEHQSILSNLSNGRNLS